LLKVANTEAPGSTVLGCILQILNQKYAGLEDKKYLEEIIESLNLVGK